MDIDVGSLEKVIPEKIFDQEMKVYGIHLFQLTNS